MSDQGNLEFTEFKVQMIYGFITEPKENFEQWFSEKLQEKKPAMRSGWTPMYRFKNEPTTVLQYRLPEETEYFITPPKIWQINGELCDISVKTGSWISLRKDGAGAITVNFKVERRNNTYDMKSLLALLLLAPRSLYGIKTTEEDEGFSAGSELTRLTRPKILIPEAINPNTQAALQWVKPSWANFSSAFQLFINGMVKFLDSAEGIVEWSELECPYNKDAENTESHNVVYDSDPQIPYMYVFATAPFSIYTEAFLEKGSDFIEKRKAREKYTKDIAAILGRWLISENIGYASADYWERRGLIQGNTFRSQYMNSLVFTTFSGAVTFSLKPDLATAKLQDDTLNDTSLRAMKLPFTPTSQSIVRCLEFSRMRWHHVLWLNRELDRLIQSVISDSTTQGIIPEFERLIELRRQAAIYLEDPFAYLWDATVGSELAKFLHTHVVEELEKSILRKLNMVKQLIEERLEILKTRDFIEALQDTSISYE